MSESDSTTVTEKTITSLFRPEVGSTKKDLWFGHVILIQPISFTFMAGFALLSSICLLVFLIAVPYTKRVRVDGVLVPDQGLIRVQSPQPGVVLNRYIREGQHVKTGDVLYSVSSELVLAPSNHGRFGNRNDISLDSKVESTSEILKTLRARQHSIYNERKKTLLIESEQSMQLAKAIEGLGNEIAQIDNEIRTQSARVRSIEIQYERNEQMQSQGYISEMALRQKNDEKLEQQGRLQAMQRSRMAMSRERGQAIAELDQLKIKGQRDQYSLDRLALELEQESVATQARRKFLITAPQAGLITAILADPGQVVNSQTLLTIVPSDARLEAQLFVPSSAAGFIEANQTVLIRYSAYPHQKFGQYRGTVVEVSRTALAPQDLPAPLASSSRIAAEDGIYRVRVSLASQNVRAYGKPLELNSGMRLEADILQDRRSLIEWVLEPLYSLRGQI